MSTFDTLPVILVSAANQVAATTLISELIDNDVTDDYLNDTQSPDRVWRLVNKYYTANVRVHTLTDNERLTVDPDSIDAHIIYITEGELFDESGGVATAEARACGGAGAWRRCGVRLLLVECAVEPGALCAWAGAARADLVPLREAAPAAPEPFADACGAERARAALHAHVWRGLVRTDRTARPLPPEASSGSSCSGSDDEEADELRAVEHAEAFAAALGALGPALAARDPLGEYREYSAHGAGARHDRAEALVTAFCRALGYDLDA